MFKKILLAGSALAMMAGTAAAADLPRRAAPPVFVPVPVFTWTGAYFGINAGYVFSESDTARTTGIGALQNNVNLGLREPGVRVSTEGFTAGGQVGYNYQFTPGNGLVVGVEADAQYTDLDSSVTRSIFIPAANPNRLTNIYRTEMSFLGTVRGRVGYAFDRFLVFGTGGFAYGDVTHSVQFQTGVPITYSGQRNQMETGYVYGGGVEYALPTDSFLNFFKTSAVTIKAEYLRYDLGSSNLLVASVGGPGIGYNTRFQNEGSIARAGINYKFGSY
ncbi:MAG: porin family protein [Methylobacterium sp.]|uniref:outer membrane protein n=1 Tax=Methylobacterium sp. TaxID=409 RepID=UPI0025D2E669|nr:porin family protein [Methylobacterium sp.]MBX9930413.1 porin family protein [Methylobacterium sp.]